MLWIYKYFLFSLFLIDPIFYCSYKPQFLLKNQRIKNSHVYTGCAITVSLIFLLINFESLTWYLKFYLKIKLKMYKLFTNITMKQTYYRLLFYQWMFREALKLKRNENDKKKDIYILLMLFIKKDFVHFFLFSFLVLDKVFKRDQQIRLIFRLLIISKFSKLFFLICCFSYFSCLNLRSKITAYLIIFCFRIT